MFISENSLRLRELLCEQSLRAHARSLVHQAIRSIAKRCLRHHNVGCLSRVVERLDGGANGGVVGGSGGRHDASALERTRTDGGSRSGRECEQDVVVKEGDVADWRLDLEFVLCTRDARLLD